MAGSALEQADYRHLAEFFRRCGPRCPHLVQKAAAEILSDSIWWGELWAIITDLPRAGEEEPPDTTEERFFRHLWEGQRL